MSGMGMEERRRGRLATWVISKRKGNRWSVETAARQAGINRITWERVERAQNVQDTTYDAVDRAFHLKTGGCEAIMAGREPEYEDFTQGPEPEPEPKPGTVEAIMADDRLTEEDKTRLIDLYERMRDDDNDHGQGRHLA